MAWMTNGDGACIMGFVLRLWGRPKVSTPSDNHGCQSLYFDSLVVMNIHVPC